MVCWDRKAHSPLGPSVKFRNFIFSSNRLMARRCSITVSIDMISSFAAAGGEKLSNRLLAAVLAFITA